MQITIHRGIDQIGGCITEIRTARSKILIDLGHNLPKGNGPSEDRFDNAGAIARLCEGCDAVFYTHYHGDHVDLFRHVPERVNQYIGPLAKAVMRIRLEHLTHVPGEKERREADLTALERFKTYEPARCIRVGKDIRVTPYFVSHSAADAYMFLIEADGKRILHTGDFRQHGYLGKGLLPTLEKYIASQGIDVLITEGTMLDRNEKKIVHENDLKRQAVELMKRYKNVFVLCSSTDMDRLATFHQANREMRNRPFVCDGYQQRILESFAGHAGVKSPLFKFDHKVYGSDERNEKLRKWMLDTGFTMLLRTSPKYRRWADSLLPELNPDETLLIYSMFRGYILPTHEAYNPDLAAFVARFPHFEYVHTSGHATTDTLAAVCRTIPPRTAILPIHRDKGSDFASLDIGDELQSKIVTASQTIDGIDFLVK